MAGEVQTKLTIELAGGLGVPTSLSAPVSRSAQILSPFQGMANYAALHSQRMAQEIAQEIARDKTASRILEEGRAKSQLRYEADQIASAVRAAEERIRRQSALAQSVRFNRQFAPDPLANFEPVGRRAGRVAFTSGIRAMKSAGYGAIAGFASSATFGASEGDGLKPFLGRAILSGASGFAVGGAPGAVAGVVMSSISEIIKGLTSGDAKIERLRESMAEWRDDLDRYFKEAEERHQALKAELERKLREEIDAIVHNTLYLYREERFQTSNLVQ